MSNKILVVDDDLNICELLKLYLENEGYTAFVANDGQAAVDTFAAKIPIWCCLILCFLRWTAGRFAGKSEKPPRCRL